jgi:hypothetical protein
VTRPSAFSVSTEAKNPADFALLASLRDTTFFLKILGFLRISRRIRAFLGKKFSKILTNLVGFLCFGAVFSATFYVSGAGDSLLLPRIPPGMKSSVE